MKTTTTIRELRHRGAAVFEIIVVVVILAVLTAIAIPNLVEGSPRRPSGSRVKSDQRSLQVALETYYIDHDAYPVPVPMTRLLEDQKGGEEKLSAVGGLRMNYPHTGDNGGLKIQAEGLTTPIAYLTSLPKDPFSPDGELPFAYDASGDKWILNSPGPDRDYDIHPDRDIDWDDDLETIRMKVILLSFDPTNGAESDGDIWRVKE